MADCLVPPGTPSDIPLFTRDQNNPSLEKALSEGGGGGSGWGFAPMGVFMVG